MIRTSRANVFVMALFALFISVPRPITEYPNST